MPLSSGCGPPPIMRLPSPAAGLDLDDLGAEVAEQLGPERAHDDGGQLDDLDAGERPAGLGASTVVIGRVTRQLCGVTSSSSTQLPSGSSIIEMRTPARISRGEMATL